MEQSKFGQSVLALDRDTTVQTLPVVREKDLPKPMLSGILYSEIAFWIMMVSIAIAVPGFILYMIQGSGYLNASNLLNHLWQGCDCKTIWKQVGAAGKPVPWYDCFGMLNRGDMLATLGIAVAGIAAVVGMWGAFLGTLRTRGGVYIYFALVIAVVLTLSALGIIKIQM